MVVRTPYLVVEVEHRSTDHQITVLKQEKSRLLVKIDQSKKDLTRLQSDISSEQVRIDRYQSDLSLHEAQKAAQQQEAAALAEERAKLEKKLQSITEERTQSLKAMFKQKVEDMMASEKKALISTISRANEPTQVPSALPRAKLGVVAQSSSVSKICTRR